MHQDDIEIVLVPVSEVSTELIRRKTLEIPNWQPLCLRLPFFIGTVILTLLHSGMCAILIVLNYAESRVFTFRASTAAAFFFWQFVPIILAVITGLMLEVIYIEVCRLQPYRDLASPHGSTLFDSLSQTYLTSFSWFVPYHASQHPKKHASVAMISIAYLLAANVLPAVSVAMIKIQWDTISNTGTAQPLIYLIILALLVSLSTVAFAVAAFVILHRQKSGLYDDPGGLAGLGTLVAESNLLQKFQSLRSFDGQDHIDNTLGDLQLCLEHTGASYQIALLDPSQTVLKMAEKKWLRDANEAHPLWLRGWTYIGLNVLTLIPLLVLYSVIGQRAVTAVQDSNPMEINGDGLTFKVCTTIVSLINAAFYANWHLNVAMLQPYHNLSHHVQKKLRGSSSALQMDFTGSAISNLTRPGQSSDVWLLAVCALLTQLAVIIRPAVYQNLGFITALGFKNSSIDELSEFYENTNIPAVMTPLRTVSYVFDGIYLIFTFIALSVVLVTKRKPFLPRKPFTLSSQILYLCHGIELLEDLKGMSMLSKKARDTRIKQNGHKYALGWVEDEAKTCSYVGINRLENISRRFRYPKQDHTEVAREHMTRENFERVYPNAEEGKTRREAGWPNNAQQVPS